jgi:hypothetical protein
LGAHQHQWRCHGPGESRHITRTENWFASCGNAINLLFGDAPTKMLEASMDA